MKYADKTCTLDGCDRPLDARGWCRAHYGRWRKHGHPLAGGPMRQRRALARRPTTPRPARLCDVQDCGRKHLARGLCKTHWVRRYELAEAHWDRPIRQQTGRSVNKHGYVLVQVPIDHPMATSFGKSKVPQYRRNHAYAFEHRVVMYEHLGRPLHPNENVHHINGDKGDNRLENLELWVRSQPSGQRVEDRVADALDLLRRYAPHLLA